MNCPLSGSRSKCYIGRRCSSWYNGGFDAETLGCSGCWRCCWGCKHTWLCLRYCELNTSFAISTSVFRPVQMRPKNIFVFGIAFVCWCLVFIKYYDVTVLFTADLRLFYRPKYFLKLQVNSISLSPKVSNFSLSEV